MNNHRVREPGALGRIREAYRVIRLAHAGQHRKGSEGELFFNHPRRVCKAYLEFQYKTLDGAIAALCHDLVEDTPVSPEDIETLFGPSVRRMVEELTKPPGVSHLDYLRHFDNWALESKKIKLCDIEDNILGSRSIEVEPRGKMMLKWGRYLSALSPGCVPADDGEWIEYKSKWMRVQALLDREWSGGVRNRSSL